MNKQGAGGDDARAPAHGPALQVFAGPHGEGVVVVAAGVVAAEGMERRKRSERMREGG